MQVDQQSMAEADWEPLPQERVCANPGEFVELGKRPAPAMPQPPQPEPVPVALRVAKVEPVLDPAAQQALQALQQQLAASQPASSWVAQALRRERRTERQRARVSQTAELAATMVQGTAPVPEIEYAPGADGRDPREEQEWFLALPEAERHRLQAAWAQKRTVEQNETALQRRNRNRRFWASMICFAATLVMGTGQFWHATVGAGIVCGIWWRHAGPCRFMDPLRALLCLGVMQGLAMAVARSMNQQLFMDAVLITSLAALVGFEGEIRRSGGFDAH